MDKMDVYGYDKDGIMHWIGKVPVTPRMKAKEIVESYFGTLGDDFDDSTMAMQCCEELIEYIEKCNKEVNHD